MVGRLVLTSGCLPVHQNSIIQKPAESPDIRTCIQNRRGLQVSFVKHSECLSGSWGGGQPGRSCLTCSADILCQIPMPHHDPLRRPGPGCLKAAGIPLPQSLFTTPHHACGLDFSSLVECLSLQLPGPFMFTLNVS